MLQSKTNKQQTLDIHQTFTFSSRRNELTVPERENFLIAMAGERKDNERHFSLSEERERE